MRKSWLSWVLLALGLASPTAAQSSNLVDDPGFEQANSPWSLDNSAQNEVIYRRDPNLPHSGLYSTELALTKVTGGTSHVAFAAPVHVRPGMAVQLRFWARGVSNGAPIVVQLRQGRTPRVEYFRVEAELADEWREYVYNTQLPASLDAADCLLRFDLDATGIFWIDDVALTELPPVDNNPAPRVNPIRNPSFEAGTDGWTATFREHDFSQILAAMEANAGAKLEIVADGAAPEGRRFLRLTVKPGCRAELTSAYFPARYGHAGEISFWIRSEGEHAFGLALIGGKARAIIKQTQRFQTAAAWRRLEYRLTPQPALGGVYCLEFDLEEPGRYEIDAVGFRETADLKPVSFPSSYAIEAGADVPAGQLFSRGAAAAFTFVAAADRPSAVSSYQMTVFDYLERQVADEPVVLTTNSTGRGTGTFTVPTGRQGAFRIEARKAGSPALLAEQIYSVLPDLAPPAARPDSFFGGHSNLTAYNLAIDRRAGFRWLRLHPPLLSKWIALEQTEGQWDFQTKQLAAAKKAGFRILGDFDTVPNFAADLDPADPRKSSWLRSYPPASLERWKAYVMRCAEQLGPYVDAWEVWNEPDGEFLTVRPGLRKDLVYTAIVRATREALTAAGNRAPLLGGAVATFGDPFTWQILDDGVGRSIDAFSFHYYSLSQGGNSPDDARIASLLQRARTYPNRLGQAMPLWHTEGGVYLRGAQSWLQTYRIPPSSAVTPPEAAATMVRAALIFKAMGVKRYFDYAATASPAGRTAYDDICQAFIDVTGIPGPQLAAHAAMVSLVEDAAAVGFEVRSTQGVKVKTARFRSPTHEIDAYWAENPLPLSAVLPRNIPAEVYDMMGNPIAPAQAAIGDFPLYVRTVRMPARQ